jgi:hypothetical protein
MIAQKIKVRSVARQEPRRRDINRVSLVYQVSLEPKDVNLLFCQSADLTGVSVLRNG